MMNEDPIVFTASFPAIQSAIKITGDGGGMRIQLDVPEIDLLNALHIIAMRQQAFRVTIDPIEFSPLTQGTNDRTISRTATKKRKR